MEEEKEKDDKEEKHEEKHWDWRHWIPLVLVGVLLGGLIGVVSFYYEKADQEIQGNLDRLTEGLEAETSQRHGNDTALDAALRTAENNLGAEIVGSEARVQERISEVEAYLGQVDNDLGELEDTLNQFMSSTATDLKGIWQDIGSNKDAVEEAKTQIASTIRNVTEIWDSNLNGTRTELTAMIQTIGADLQGALKRINYLKSKASKLGNRIDTINQSLDLVDQWSKAETSKLGSEIHSLDTKNKQFDQRIDGLSQDVGLFKTEMDKTIGEIKASVTNQTEAIEDIWSNLTYVWNQLSEKAGYWNTLSELLDWLAIDMTDKNHWTTSYDCDDFATDLARNALDVGRLIYPICVLYDTVYYNEDYPGYFFVDEKNFYLIQFSDGDWDWLIANHMVDLTYTKDYGWIMIEPQTDAIALLGTHEL